MKLYVSHSPYTNIARPEEQVCESYYSKVAMNRTEQIAKSVREMNTAIIIFLFVAILYDYKKGYGMFK